MSHRWRSKPILVRADGAGDTHALISALSAQGLSFSVGYPVTDAVRYGHRADAGVGVAGRLQRGR